MGWSPATFSTRRKSGSPAWSRLEKPGRSLATRDSKTRPRGTGKVTSTVCPRSPCRRGGERLRPRDEENPAMSYQRFTFSRAIALSLSVALLTAAPLLCIHPICTQINKAQRVAMKQNRERGVVPGRRTSPSRLAAIPRPASTPGPLAHTARCDNKEEAGGGESHLKAPLLVEVTRAAGLPLPEPAWNEMQVPGMTAPSASPATGQ
jgi:hypothetical protein